MSVKHGEKEMVFRCDNQGCTKTARRKIVVHRYDRKTGNTYRHHRKPTHPVPYWQKLLEPDFFLSGYKWPDGVTVLCKKCHDAQERIAAHKPKPLSKQRQQEIERWQEQEERRYR